MPTFEEILDATIAEMPAPGAEPAEEVAADDADKPAEGSPPAEEKKVDGAVEPAEEKKPEGEGEAADKEKTEAEPAKEEPAKEEAKPQDGSLARKLALVAREERRLKAEKAAHEGERAKLKPDLELGTALREARALASKMEGAKKALQLDDEGIAELYLELHEHLGGAGGEKAAAAVKPEAQIAKLVAKTVAEKLAEHKKTEEAEQTALQERGRQMFADDVRAELKSSPKAYRFCAVAPPSVPDIAAITEEIARGTGRMPRPEEVLKTIEDHRRGLYEANGESPKPEPKKETAPGKGEPSGKQTPPIRRDDAPVNTSTKRLSFEEALEAEIEALQQR